MKLKSGIITYVESLCEGLSTVPPRTNPSHKLISRGGLNMARKLTTKEFVKKANIVHNNKYDYSFTDYKNGRSKVEIVCTIHGKFEQVAKEHLRGHGCSRCGELARSLTQIEFIKKAKEIHNSYYSYAKSVYTNTDSVIIIICPEHGEFTQNAREHLRGKRCTACVNLKRHTTSELLERIKSVHGDVYDYSEFLFVSSRQKLKILCPKHGSFWQKPYDHLEGNGCPSCAKGGFDPNKSAILYYLKITTNDNTTLYKIGITNRSVNERFSLLELKKIEIIKQIEFPNGVDAYNKEQEILKKYSEYAYKGPKVLASGNTELFTEDVLAVEAEDFATTIKFEVSL